MLGTDSAMQIACKKTLATTDRAITPQFFFLGVLASSPFVLAVALFLAARRVVGALSDPLPPLPLLAMAALLLGWVGAVRAALRGRASRPANLLASPDKLLVGASWVSLLLVAFGCSYPGNRAVDWLVWLPTIALAWFGSQISARVRHKLNVRSLFHHISGKPVASISPTDRIVQRLTRYRTADGRDMLHAELQAEFDRGERNSTLYVAFCPPFERLPQVNADISDDVLADVKMTQVLHNGAQLDVRLSSPGTERTTVNIELVASES